MKHTYIFKLSDTLNQDDLYRLASVADKSNVSWTGEMSSHYKWVRVFTDSASIHGITHRAGFSGEHLRIEIPRAKLNGDEAYAESQSKLNQKRPLVPSGARKETKPPAPSLFRPLTENDLHGFSPEAKQRIRQRAAARIAAEAVLPAWSVVMLERLTRAGCDVKVNVMHNRAMEIIVFGESFTMLDENEARGFLIGLERGFREISDTQIVDAALVDPSAPGSPQMGSTKATKRSKRSC